MKCIHCGAELEQDAKFCSTCGAAQPQQPAQQKICPHCGQTVDMGVVFCPFCGQDTNQPAQAGGPAPAYPQQPKGKGCRVALIFLLIAALLIGGATVLLVRAFYHSRMPESHTSVTDTLPPDVEQELGEAQGDVSAIIGEDIPESDADLMIDERTQTALSGYIKITAQGERFLEWDEDQNMLLQQSNGNTVLVEDVHAIYLQANNVSDAQLAMPDKGTEVTVTGIVKLNGNRLYMYVDRLTDLYGNPIEKHVTADAPAVASSDYILPQSNQRLLTETDINGLSLQQLNYAKNEIYARHGRKFDSKELQNYFNSQSWYSGTVAPSNFSENVLSQVERANADMLAAREFSISPNGYVLDR